MRHIAALFLFYIFNQANIFAQDITFSWMSDLHIGGTTAEQNLIESVENINKNESNEFTIISGDIVESGRLPDLNLAKEILSRLKKPFYIIPGNHELKWSGSAGKDFRDVFGDDKFHFKHKGFHFIGLHQGPILRMADGIFSPEILRWLKNEMEGIKKNEPVIVVFHYPLDSSVSNWYECYDILKNYNTAAILVGHGHQNADLDFNGIHGVMGRSNLERGQISSGYNVVNINKDTISFYHKANVMEQDSLWNRFILTAPKPNPLDKKYPLMTVNDNYPNIKIKWIYDDEHTITSAPVLIGNSVVVSSGKGITILDRESGKMKWQYKTEEAVYPAPAIYKNNAIFTSGDGYVYSVDFVNKKLVWKFFCESASVAAPNVESERVYVGSSSGNFYCLDAKDGNLIWKYSGVDGYVESRPSIYKDKIVFGAWDNYLYCLNKNSGELLWKWSNGRNNILLSPAVCTPVIKDDNVFIVAPDRYLSMININTGETLLRTNRYAVREAIGIAEDSLLIFSKSMYDTAFACRVKNDTLIYEWTAKLDYGYDFAPSYPMNKSGTLYFGTKNGFVYALDSKNGSMKWKYKLNDCLVNDICPISDKSLIVSSLNGKVYYLYDAGISKHDNFTFSHGGIVRLDTAKKNIYLAFTGHDFSDGKYIIQQVLKKNGARASFFFTGDFYRNEENKEIIMQLKKDGSYLGAHSDKHLLYCDWVNRDSSLVSKDSFMVDLANNYTELEKIGIGKNEALYYMPPYEWYNKEISEWCEEFGIQIINFTPGTYSNADYTVPSMGNRYLSSDTIYNRIIRYEQNSSNGLNGFILLLHIGTDEERTDKMYNRLDGLIFELKKKGYKFLSLKDIL